ncbi:deoxynucleotide monophosphate kinase [Agrobacterium tumefaciens]|uniref:deoxynucleotide monophosphate kinase n=1 Tax=Agrobacterium tumefaciens TaxID=358 RepID=UPI001ADAE3F7|nr:deoxynucleotide monophosphate kinase [Agrobacterium tumefaciens]
MTITSKDTGCLTAVPANDNVPAELLALGAAIGKASTTILPPVIALTGLAGSGKSTASKYLVETHGYQLVKFAGPLKDMLRAIGLGEGHIEGAHKETDLAMLSGHTPRHAMQTLGTEWGRKCMGDDFWVNLWRSRADGVLAFGGRVVVDDCRFQNEADEVRKLGGLFGSLSVVAGLLASMRARRGVAVRISRSTIPGKSWICIASLMLSCIGTWKMRLERKKAQPSAGPSS